MLGEFMSGLVMLEHVKIC